MSSRAGGATALTSSAPEPLVGQPFTEVGGGAGFALTTPVGTDVDAFEPSLFRATTRTRSVLPWSTSFSVYDFSVAPLMSEQLPPLESQRRQLYAYAIVAVLSHWPVLAVSVWPTCVVPEIVGGDWFTGALAALDMATPAKTAKPTTATARVQSARFFTVPPFGCCSLIGARQAKATREEQVNST